MLGHLLQLATSKVPHDLPLGQAPRSLQQGCLLLAVLSLVQTPTERLLSLGRPNLVARARPVGPHEMATTAKVNLPRLKVHAAGRNSLAIPLRLHPLRYQNLVMLCPLYKESLQI